MAAVVGLNRFMFTAPVTAGLPAATQAQVIEAVITSLRSELCDEHGVWQADYVRLRVHAAAGDVLFDKQGELILTEHGIEGGVVYAASRLLREQLNARGTATAYLDLLPQHTLEQVHSDVAHPRGARSMSSHLASRLGLKGVRAALLHEVLSKDDWGDSSKVAQMIKALPITLHKARPIAEAISSAGGVAFSELNGGLMLDKIAGVFCAGEMLDWEAPTGGYLLTACLATGRVAGEGVVEWLQ